MNKDVRKKRIKTLYFIEHRNKYQGRKLYFSKKIIVIRLKYILQAWLQADETIKSQSNLSISPYEKIDST